MNFLKANWEQLILVNYSINPSLLKSYIPKGTELDLFNNTCYVSLVGFMFTNTKVLGLKIPFHINFEEVNLRFYVKHKDQGTWKRGVVFIKEIVSKPVITFIANKIYHEHYQTLPMNHQWNETENSKHVEYQWKIDGKTQYMKVETEKNSSEIIKNSEAEFITEHYFGYTKYKNKTFEYEIEHLKWMQFNVKKAGIEVDFNLNYGNSFEILNHQKPTSVILAEGSKIIVKNKNLITK